MEIIPWNIRLVHINAFAVKYDSIDQTQWSKENDSNNNFMRNKLNGFRHPRIGDVFFVLDVIYVPSRSEDLAREKSPLLENIFIILHVKWLYHVYRR